MRLLFREAVIEVGGIGVLVMAISIIIDYRRSRALYGTAKKYRSQALEADAVHFSTDLISSAIVLVGIIPTILGFQYFDSVSAIGVAIVIFAISFRIGRKSVNTLMDRAPKEFLNNISEEIMAVEGVEKVGQIRVRESGAYIFIDATVFINKKIPLESAHDITDRISDRIRKRIPNSDIVVHVEPL